VLDDEREASGLPPERPRIETSKNGWSAGCGNCSRIRPEIWMDQLSVIEPCQKIGARAE